MSVSEKMEKLVGKVGQCRLVKSVQLEKPLPPTALKNSE